MSSTSDAAMGRCFASSAAVSRQGWGSTRHRYRMTTDPSGSSRGGLRTRCRIVCTVPSPKVDSLIHLGQRLRILEGMAEHEHYGFVPADTVELFTNCGFALRRTQRFQLGLNNLFVFATRLPAPVR